MTETANIFHQITALTSAGPMFACGVTDPTFSTMQADMVTCPDCLAVS
mgnify:CR=1 FL=1